MSLDGSYHEGNVFALILAERIPSTRLYEDAETLAFLDAFPQTRGHALVVSKTSRARTLLEVESDALCAVMVTVQRVARAIRDALAPDGIRIVQYNGAAAGQTVFHLHVHIMPVWDGGTSGLPDGQRGMADPALLEEIAGPIRAALASAAPTG